MATKKSSPKLSKEFSKKSSATARVAKPAARTKPAKNAKSLGPKSARPKSAALPQAAKGKSRVTPLKPASVKAAASAGASAKGSARGSSKVTPLKSVSAKAPIIAANAAKISKATMATKGESVSSATKSRKKPTQAEGTSSAAIVSKAKKPAGGQGAAKVPKVAKNSKAASPVKAPKPEKAASAASSKALREGDQVPDFSAQSSKGEVSAASLRGKPFVLYFYPKDDTPGCTREACGFRDNRGAFQAAGLDVFGVSPDSTQSHDRFDTKYGLGFPLLSDSEKEVAKAFGVWVKKKNYGKEYMGIERSTFLIDGSGKIRRIWHNVKVDGHAEMVLEAAREL